MNNAPFGAAPVADSGDEYRLIAQLAEQIEQVLDQLMVRGFSLAQQTDCRQLQELATQAEEYGLQNASDHLQQLGQQLEQVRGGLATDLAPAMTHFHFLTEYAVILRQLAGLDLQQLLLLGQRQVENHAG